MKQCFGTLRSRLVFTLVVMILLCLAMLGSVSYRAMHTMERTRLQTAIQSDVQRLSDHMSAEYRALIYLSQQMIPTGTVGLALEEYLSADTRFAKISASQQVSEQINVAAFSNPEVVLVTYFEEEEGEIITHFNNLAVRDGFSPGSLDTLRAMDELDFHAVHLSQSRVSNRPVVSVARRMELQDGRQWAAYLESRTDIFNYLSQLSRMQEIPYYLLQVDREGLVRYSNLAEYPAGSRIPMEEAGEGLNQLGEYLWVRSSLSFGFYNLLLVPEASYRREINEWWGGIAVAAGLSLVLILFTALILHSQFYRPLKLLEQEMGRFGSGNLNPRSYRFGVREYDSLFGRFNLLKGQVGNLMADVKQKEEEKRQLELDKLYYQINPHFLMNALNSAYWMANMSGQEPIATYISRLNYLLGYSLGKVSQNTTLRSELQLLESYLDLQKERYDLHAFLDVEPGRYLDGPCARLILQPIVENAICHSIDDCGNLWITVRCLEGKITEIIIRDDGCGFDTAILRESGPDAEEDKRRGIGLRYVQLSLEAYYKGEAVMAVDSAPGQGTAVTLRLPQNV